MHANGFLGEGTSLCAADVVGRKTDGKSSGLLCVNTGDLLHKAIEIMQNENVSQLVVTDGKTYVGSLSENRILNLMLTQPSGGDALIGEVMEKPFPHG